MDNLKYDQPHNITISSGNVALDSILVEKAHNSDKHKAISKKILRMQRRRDDILSLAEQGRLFCNSSKEWLVQETVLKKKCYIGHRNPPICPYLFYQNGRLRPYKK